MKKKQAAETTDERPSGGTGSVIYDANKGIKKRREDDNTAELAPIEEGGLALRLRQEKMLAHTFVKPSTRGQTHYDNSWMPERVYELLSNRDVIFTQKMIASRLNCDVSTLKRWKAIHEDLRAAVAQGLAEQEGWLATMMAGGIKYSASVYAVLKNLHDWSDKIDQRTTVDLTEAIRKQAQGAKRVQWDKALPDPVAAQKAALPTRTAQSSDSPLPPPSTSPLGMDAQNAEQHIT